MSQPDTNHVPSNSAPEKLVANSHIQAAVAPTTTLAPTSLEDASLYFNRELSWLEFNRRVLMEAWDPTVPLLERLKFIGIFGNNLDEFYMVRVATLKERFANDIVQPTGGDRLSPREQLDAVSEIAHELADDAIHCLTEAILPALEQRGLKIVRTLDLTEEERVYCNNIFRKQVFPVLTPLAVDPSHPFPQLLNNSLNLAVRLRRPAQSELLFAVVQVPAVLQRFVVLPGRPDHQVFPLELLIQKSLDQLFPGMDIVDSYVFRVTRDSDFDLDDFEEIEDLVAIIEQQIREHRRGAATRLEIDAQAPIELQEYLREALDLEAQDVFKSRGLIDLRSLFELYDTRGFDKFRYPDYVPRVAPNISRAKSLFSAIREGDILLHHPYDSFKPVVDFVNSAADDPNVLAIKQTLYRTNSDSPIIRALLRAADRGKQVTALIELQARLDEERNITWAKMLEKAGVHVVFGIVGYKTHCKAALVVRRDEDGIRRYVHLATGNYNPVTARIYTDLALFTCREEFVDDVSALFNYLTGYSEIPVWKKLVVAPSRLLTYLLESIAKETALGPAGRIVAKLNAILEPIVIQALYKASQAGVKITLLCRGICGLRPGIKGVSENITVRSTVDRFLEHARIYYFGNQGKPQVYLASADWMDRNLHRRIEVMFPIEDPVLKQRVIDILRICMADNVKARELQFDGTWKKVEPIPGMPVIRSQQYFLDMGLAEDGRATLQPPLASLPTIDLTQPSAPPVIDPSKPVEKTPTRQRFGRKATAGSRAKSKPS